MRSGKAMMVMGGVALLATMSCAPAPPIPPATGRTAADPRALLRGLALDESAAAPTRPIMGTAAAPLQVAPPFIAAAQSDADGDRALQCLTAAVYHEARSESADGQRAVAQVVLNRVRDRAFPASVCGVVYQGAQRRTGCQFSFTCDGSLWRPREPAAWNRARTIAQAALSGAVYAPVGAATFYHANFVMPWWAASMSRVATVGAHLFYRWRGAMARTLAFRQQYAAVEPEPPLLRRPDPLDAAPQVAWADDAGITVHRGTDAVPRRLLVAAEVRIHRGVRPTIDQPRADGAVIGEEDGAI